MLAAGAPCTIPGAPAGSSATAELLLTLAGSHASDMLLRQDGQDLNACRHALASGNRTACLSLMRAAATSGAFVLMVAASSLHCALVESCLDMPGEGGLRLLQQAMEISEACGWPGIWAQGDFTGRSPVIIAAQVRSYLCLHHEAACLLLGTLHMSPAVPKQQPSCPSRATERASVADCKGWSAFLQHVFTILHCQVSTTATSATASYNVVFMYCPAWLCSCNCWSRSCR